MKVKSVAISLLLLWVFQILFTLIYFQIAKNRCYDNFRQTKHNIDNRLIETFTFANNESIVWENENKEFEINGHFYDVVKIIKTDSNTIINCISDETESKLKAVFLDRFLNQKQNSKQKIKLQVDKFVVLLDNKENANFKYKQCFILLANKAYTSCKLEILIPPPKA